MLKRRMVRHSNAILKFAQTHWPKERNLCRGNESSLQRDLQLVLCNGHQLDPLHTVLLYSFRPLLPNQWLKSMTVQKTNQGRRLPSFESRKWAFKGSKCSHTLFPNGDAHGGDVNVDLELERCGR